MTACSSFSMSKEIRPLFTLASNVMLIISELRPLKWGVKYWWINYKEASLYVCMNLRKVYNDVCCNLLYCYYSSLPHITVTMQKTANVTEVEWFITILRYQQVPVHGNS